MAGYYKNEIKYAEYNKGYDIRDYEKVVLEALKVCTIYGDLNYVIY